MRKREKKKRDVRGFLKKSFIKFIGIRPIKPPEVHIDKQLKDIYERGYRVLQEMEDPEDPEQGPNPKELPSVFITLPGIIDDEVAKQYAVNCPLEVKLYLSDEIVQGVLNFLVTYLLSSEEKVISNIVGPRYRETVWSAMTLYMEIDPKNDIYKKIIDRYFNGVVHTATINKLESLYNQETQVVWR